MEGARPRVSSTVSSCSLAEFPPLAAAVSLLVKQEDWTGRQAGWENLFVKWPSEKALSRMGGGGGGRASSVSMGIEPRSQGHCSD